MKKKGLFFRIFACMLICCFSFLFVACGGGGLGSREDLQDQFENGEMTDEEFEEAMKGTLSAPLYGTKVLYRPEHYDFDQGGGSYASYYAKYAYTILETLIYNYGVARSPDQADLLEYYQYDSIRYQVTSFANITKEISADGEESKVAYYLMQVDTNADWNMSLPYDNDEIAIFAFPNDPDVQTSFMNNVIEINGTLSAEFYTNQEDSEDAILQYYTNPNNTTSYVKSFLAPAYESALPSDGENRNEELGALIASNQYSDVVKSVEYTLYCFALDLTPQTVTFTEGSSATQPINVSIGGQSAQSQLDYIKEVFNNMGSTVGVSSRMQTKLIDWILDTIIGEDARANDTVVYYDNATKNKDGSYTLGTPSKTVTNARDYENTVEEIISTVCEQVQIGNVNDDDVNIDDRFLASEVKDFWGDLFSIDVNNEEDPFVNIPAMEYQSAVLMFNDDLEDIDYINDDYTTTKVKGHKVENLWLVFQYDAGNDGLNNVDPNASITIRVHLNAYINGVYMQDVAESQMITVPDGPMDYGNTGMVMFLKIGDTKNGLIFNSFNTEVGNGILKAMDKYDGSTLISDPLILVGTTELKDYYKLIEPEEPLADGTTYTYGILDHTKLTGADQTDYLEIAYEVIKVAGDTETNYKFQTGIAFIA